MFLLEMASTVGITKSKRSQNFEMVCTRVIYGLPEAGVRRFRELLDSEKRVAGDSFAWRGWAAVLPNFGVYLRERRMIFRYAAETQGKYSPITFPLIHTAVPNCALLILRTAIAFVVFPAIEQIHIGERRRRQVNESRNRALMVKLRRDFGGGHRVRNIPCAIE